MTCRRVTLVWMLLSLLGIAACKTEEAACHADGRAYPVGARWTCSDGCNFCECTAADGETESISSSLIGCSGPPGPAAGKLLCEDARGEHRHGDSWDCGNCQRCTCNDGTIQRQAGGACDAGVSRRQPAGGAAADD